MQPNRFNLGLLIPIQTHILGAEIFKCRNLLEDTTFIPIFYFRKNPHVSFSGPITRSGAAAARL